MSRVIKFRSYGCINHYEDRMVYLADEDNYFIDNEGELIYVQTTEGGCDYIGFDNVKIMQYTGLVDKNGVEIYEGDIVKRTEMGYTFIQTVEFKESSFGTGGYFFTPLSTKGKYDDGKSSSEFIRGYEVLGNIYENSDILE